MKKKLVLRKQTIRQLNDVDFRDVGGAAINVSEIVRCSWWCPSALVCPPHPRSEAATGCATTMGSGG